MDLEEKIPRINWPDESGTYKVVQLTINSKPFLCFPTNKSVEIHAQILENLLKRFGIRHDVDYLWVKGMYFALTENGCVIPGMDLADVNIDNKHVRFYGRSRDYNLGIDRNHISSLEDQLTGWTVTVDE